MKQNLKRRPVLTIYPRTYLGAWAIILIIVFILLFIILSWIVVYSSRIVIIFAALLFYISGISGFLSGIISIVWKKERSILVFVATIIGFLIIIFVLSAFLSAH